MSTPLRVMLMDDDPQHIQRLTSRLTRLELVALKGPPLSCADLSQRAQEANTSDIILADLGCASPLHPLLQQVAFPQWVVVTSGTHTADQIVQAFCDGARGAIAWDADEAAFAHCILQISQRRPYFSQAVAQHIQHYMQQKHLPLTPMQQATLDAFAHATILDAIIATVQSRASTAPVTERSIYAHLDSILRTLQQAGGAR